MELMFLPYNAQEVAQLRAGGPDVYGNPAERAVSDGQGNPCRSCLQQVPKDDEMLICAARPFGPLQPYAETGPVFFCAAHCTAFSGMDLPPILTTSPDYLVKAYDEHERIVYGTGQITDPTQIQNYAEGLLDRPDIAFVDVRSARNNCFLTRIVRRR